MDTKLVKAFWLPLLVCMVLCWATEAAADSLVRVPAVSNVGPGGDVVVPITVDPADGVISMQFRLQYDPAVVTPTGVFKTVFSDSFEYVYNVPTPGDLRITLYGTASVSGSGEVVWVVFHAIGAVGSYSNLVWLQHDLNEGEIPSVTSDGRVNIVAGQSTISMPDDAKAGPGAVALVPVNAYPADGYIGVGLDIRWNPLVLGEPSVSAGDLPPGWTVIPNLTTPGRALIALFGPTPLSGRGTLVNISYLVTGSLGQQTPLDIVTGTVNEGAITVVLDDGLFTVSCDDGNPCTDDSFDGSVCVHTNSPVGSACGSPAHTVCDNPDTCNGAGTCLPNYEPSTTLCRPATGACDQAETCTGSSATCPTDQHAPDGTACNDGNACTTGDACSVGVCTGTPVPPPPPVNDTVRVGKAATTAVIVWADPPGPFNVYRGQRLGASWSYNQTCLQSNASGSSLDSLMPGAGTTLYYLVTRLGACGESRLGSASDGTERPNDAPCSMP